MSTDTPVILVDMDGVIADLESAFWTRWAARHPGAPGRELAKVDEFYLEDQLPEPWADLAEPIRVQPGFYASFPTVPGAQQALNDMLAEGLEVFICTAPHLDNPTCASDKLAWLSTHIGPGWERRAIITKDKGAVRGDLLIDDKPTIGSWWTPTWTQVLFDRPYNTGVPGPRLHSWDQWRQVLAPLLGAQHSTAR